MNELLLMIYGGFDYGTLMKFVFYPVGIIAGIIITGLIYPDMKHLEKAFYIVNFLIIFNALFIVSIMINHGVHQLRKVDVISIDYKNQSLQIEIWEVRSRIGPIRNSEWSEWEFDEIRRKK